MSSFKANQGPLKTGDREKLEKAAQIFEEGGFTQQATFIRSWKDNDNWQCPPGVRPEDPNERV